MDSLDLFDTNISLEDCQPCCSSEHRSDDSSSAICKFWVYVGGFSSYRTERALAKLFSRYRRFGSAVLNNDFRFLVLAAGMVYRRHGLHGGTYPAGEHYCAKLATGGSGDFIRLGRLGFVGHFSGRQVAAFFMASTLASPIELF